MQQIHEHHEQFLIEKSGILPSLKTVPVLILDCNEEFETNPEILKNHFAQIKQFMYEQQVIVKKPTVENSTPAYKSDACQL